MFEETVPDQEKFGTIDEELEAFRNQWRDEIVER